MTTKVQPPGAPYHDKWYIPRPHEESLALRYLDAGKPVLVWGPRQYGRNWFARHVVSRWQGAENNADSVVLDVNLETFGESEFASFEAFLEGFLARAAEDLAEQTDVDPDAIVDAFRDGRGPATTRANRALSRSVLGATEGRVLVVVRHADLVLPCPFYSDFAGILRAWAEKGAVRDPWTRLRLLVTVSTFPSKLATEQHQSPFANLCDPIMLDDFQPEQVATLVDRYGLPWGAGDIERLMKLVGGHPYLLRVVLTDIVDGLYDLQALERGDTPATGLLPDLLKRHRRRLDVDPAMSAAFAAIQEDAAVPVDPAVGDALIRLGLVLRGPGGTHTLRYPIYERLSVQGEAAGHRRARIFFSYSHRDEQLRERLEVHLKLLQRLGLIDPWTDRCIKPGEKWAEEIDRGLVEADVVLLLVSADFLASDYCWDNEMKQAIARHEAGETIVVPVILRPVDFKGTPFEMLQALPKDARPVTRWADPEDAWVDVAERIRKLVEERVAS